MGGRRHSGGRAVRSAIAAATGTVASTAQCAADRAPPGGLQRLGGDPSGVPVFAPRARGGSRYPQRAEPSAPQAPGARAGGAHRAGDDVCGVCQGYRPARLGDLAPARQGRLPAPSERGVHACAGARGGAGSSLLATSREACGTPAEAPPDCRDRQSSMAAGLRTGWPGAAPVCADRGAHHGGSRRGQARMGSGGAASPSTRASGGDHPCHRHPAGCRGADRELCVGDTRAQSSPRHMAIGAAESAGPTGPAGPAQRAGPSGPPHPGPTSRGSVATGRGLLRVCARGDAAGWRRGAGVEAVAPPARCGLRYRPSGAQLVAGAVGHCGIFPYVDARMSDRSPALRAPRAGGEMPRRIPHRRLAHASSHAGSKSPSRGDVYRGFQRARMAHDVPVADAAAPPETPAARANSHAHVGAARWVSGPSGRWGTWGRDDMARRHGTPTRAESAHHR